jgi:8-oxo-dGTP pyrophosphatase MutT (NUDIX family)
VATGTRAVSVNALGFVVVGEAADDEAGRWRAHGERVIYEGPELWFGQVDVSLPSRERVWQHVVRLPQAVAVALVDGQDRVLLVRRHRFVQDRWGWELPGGLVDEDGEPGEAVVRELEEQTGYAAGQLDHMVAFQPVAAVLDHEQVVFAGRDPQRVSDPVSTEGIQQVEWVPLVSVPELIASGEVWDGASVVGLLSLLGQN